jgi:hypothetical protein
MESRIFREYGRAISLPFARNLGLKPGDVTFTVDGAVLKGRPRGARPCMPFSLPVLDGFALFPFKVIQASGVIVVLHEHDNLFRQIFLDGRPLPKDPNPTWLGYSVGRWDGDVLVVNTAGFNDRNVIPGGGPYSSTLHVIERFQRKDFGHLDIQFAIDDPKIYKKPWSFTRHYHLLPDTELLEYICMENEQDIKHIVDTTK